MGRISPVPFFFKYTKYKNKMLNLDNKIHFKNIIFIVFLFNNS